MLEICIYFGDEEIMNTPMSWKERKICTVVRVRVIEVELRQVIDCR